MSVVPQLTVALIEEADIIAARQRARQVAELVGFDKQDQTRIATAVSEIARNALTYGGGGRVELAIEKDDDPRLIVKVRDKGPGIADIDAILEGRYRSATGMGVGITGTQRLMDGFDLQSGPEGTHVTLTKRLPGAARLTNERLKKIGKELAASALADPLAEVRTQNQELMESLAALHAKQEETERLNAELEHTNRGVGALHAELEQKASALSSLNQELETRIAAAVAECQQVNDTLRQSQKMEAVGQLTGGIAHDFNNLLQIVTGNLEILTRRLPEDADRARRAADNAMAGAQRAATLTQRLLAFSRRQPLSPRPLDPNGLIEGMSDLMRRTLGEQMSLKTDLARDLWGVEVDANQLENAVLNLAVNARDAMPGGGALTITTRNTVIGEAEAEDDAVPGQYVALSVCDTGSGMSRETLSRVFEPFFTTKEVGKGTGLGLSMVYGFVKQSGGHLRIESSLGRGATVSLFLPRLIGEVAPAVEVILPTEEGAHAGEVVLLVEDDDGVRAFSAEVLADLGYTVIEAADGEDAVGRLDSPARIDLLFTDVVLAGAMTGRDVADHCAAQRQSLRSSSPAATPATPSSTTAAWTKACTSWPSRSHAPSWRRPCARRSTRPSNRGVARRRTRRRLAGDELRLDGPRPSMDVARTRWTLSNADGLLSISPSFGGRSAMLARREASKTHQSSTEVLPRYHQLYLSLRQHLLDGTFEIGKALPSEDKIGDKFGFSRATVRRTFEILEREGLINRRQGVGTFPVPQKNTADPKRQNDIYIKYTSAGALDYHNELIKYEYIPTPHFLDASDNGFGPVVLKTVRLTFLMGVSTHLITGHTSTRVSDLLGKAELSNLPIIGILKRAGEEVETPGVSIGAGAAGVFEASQLGVPLSSPLVVAERISSLHGKSVDHTLIQSRADYFRYSYSVDNETGFLKSSVSPNLFKAEDIIV